MMLAACLAVAMPAQAQLKFGVKGGLNMSKLTYEGDKIGDNTTGFFIGPMAEFTLPVIGLGVDGAIMYSQRGGKISTGDVSGVSAEADLKQQGIEIPINLKYTFGLGSTLGVYIAAGPDFFYNFKDVDIANFKSTDAQVGLNLGAGVKLLGHLQAGVTYQIPLGSSFKLDSVLSDVTNDFNTKTKTWQVHVAYIF